MNDTTTMSTDLDLLAVEQRPQDGVDVPLRALVPLEVVAQQREVARFVTDLVDDDRRPHDDADRERDESTPDE